MSTYPIPFNRPGLTGQELNYIADAIQRGHISGDGYYTKQCHRLLEETLSIRKALLTTSCTHALEMSAILLNIQAGDEVICPDFTFVSTINAFVLRGARPVFVDVRPDTLNLDETLLEAAITPRTKAILVVHYGGVACEMDTILEIAKRYGIPVIEDNAHGLFARYKGRYLGTMGVMATQSFHETKNFQCGEGGALLINAAEYAERAEIIREKGTNRSRFFRGQVDKYTWVDVGSSYLPSDMLAAHLYAQLENRDVIQGKRQRIWDTYNTQLAGWADQYDVQLPTVPTECEQSYHVFYMVMPSLASRQALINHLKAEGILSVFHYLPLHLSDMGVQYGGKPMDCPVTERLGDCLIRLPLFNDLTEHEQTRVIETIQQFKGWE
ncbi:MAG: dTDP-4-amino-4,6-dideoxygalactose transaminase [Anaerolineae bacterium]|nr:dTDP-4-amino-4,6-dideoxygalactose transaminase [Anaerolineae bacterium]MBN8619133.1 dTDP-4-amino-4,6-dideoxygalactose transaminase [Anaerolineae bacterium]